MGTDPEIVAAGRRFPAECAEHAEVEQYGVPPLGGGALGYLGRGEILMNCRQPTRDRLKPGLRTAASNYRDRPSEPFSEARRTGIQLTQLGEKYRFPTDMEFCG